MKERPKKVFNKGDVVCLRSGGPKMTVCETDRQKDETICCRWFPSFESKPFQHWFFEEELVECEP